MRENVSSDEDKTLLPVEVARKVEKMEAEFNYSDDVRFKIIRYHYPVIVAVYLEHMINYERLSNCISLIQLEKEVQIDRELLTFGVSKLSEDQWDICVEQLLHGGVLFIQEDKEEVYTSIFTVQESRSIEEPKNEQVIRGSHEGFVENLQTNVQLIRTRIRSEDLKITYLSVGTRTHNRVAMIYMDSITDKQVVKKIEDRFNAINSDMFFSMGYIEEFIEDNTLSPFPQILNTERPDRICAYLMEGKVALITDKSPTGLVVPSNFFSFYQSPDDYNSRFMVGSFYRIIRLVSFIIAILLPAMYIAVVSFHFEIIPDQLILPTKQAVELIPYQPLVEAFILELTIELIREAGIRLPNPIGQTIGIVGGLVIGDAVVKAGLISNLMIIVVALTAIASFVVPSVEMNTSVRILRFPFMITASMFGFYGIMIGLMCILIHLIRLESFGAPYLYPIAPFDWKGIKDTFVRLPSFTQKDRPADIHIQDRKRQGRSKGWKK